MTSFTLLLNYLCSDLKKLIINNLLCVVLKIKSNLDYYEYRKILITYEQQNTNIKVKFSGTL